MELEVLGGVEHGLDGGFDVAGVGPTEPPAQRFESAVLQARSGVRGSAAAAEAEAGVRRSVDACALQHSSGSGEQEFASER